MADANTTLELLEYYSNLLIKQYSGKPKAIATVRAFVRGFLMAQTSVWEIAFPSVPSSGNWRLTYNGNSTSSLAHNADSSDLQIALRLLPGLSSIHVSGNYSTFSPFRVRFDGVAPPVRALSLGTSTLDVTPVLTEVDQTLPLAVMNGYNLLGPGPTDTAYPQLAVGKQLDVLGKYAGVSRTGVGTGGQPITLIDSDFLQLIRMAIVTNNSGSSLETIQVNLDAFFPNEVRVTDYLNMRMSYLIASTLGSTDLLQMFITQNLLPRPMGVQLSVAIVPDVTNLFVFRTYRLPPATGKPFNQYTTFDQTWRWLSYADFL